MSKIRKIFDEETLQDAPPSPVSPISPTDSIYERFSHMGHHTTVTTSAHNDDKEQRRPTHNRQLSIASILNPEPEDDHHLGSSSQHNQHMQSSSPQSRGTPELTMQLRHDEALPSNWHQEHYGQEYTVMASRTGSGASWHAPHGSRQSPSRSPELDVIVEGQAPMGYHSSMDRTNSQTQPHAHNSNHTYDPTRSQLSERYPFWPCQYQLILEEDPSQVIAFPLSLPLFVF